MKNKPSQITLDFIQDIQTRGTRKVEFLWENIIIHRNVFPVDSPFSHSSMMMAKNIPNDLKTVRDVWTGTWVQAVIAAKRCAQKVIATDIDDNALKNARENITYHWLQDIIQLRKWDLFEAIETWEKFDLIISQLPFVDCNYPSKVWHFLFDTNFKLHERLLAQAKNHLNINGKMLLTTWEIGDEKRLLNLIKQYDYIICDVKEEICNDVKWKLYVLMDNAKQPS